MRRLFPQVPVKRIARVSIILLVTLLAGIEVRAQSLWATQAAKGPETCTAGVPGWLEFQECVRIDEALLRRSAAAGTGSVFAPVPSGPIAFELEGGEVQSNHVVLFGRATSSAHRIQVTLVEGLARAWVTDETGTWVIRPTREGSHALFRLRLERKPAHPRDYVVQDEDVGLRINSHPKAARKTASESMTLLVAYTPAVSARLGQAGVASLLADWQAWTNQAFANGGRSDLTISIVASAEVPYAESGDLGTDLTRLRLDGDGWMDTVHGLRVQHGADLVHLIVDDAAGGSCGIANLSQGWMRPDFGFGVSAETCGPDTFAHELGHNLGMVHDRYVEPQGQDASWPWAYGYVEPGFAHKTIMAYGNQCADSGEFCPTIQYFSKPSDLVNGLPIGIAEVPGQRSAHNVRVATDMVPVIAQHSDWLHPLCTWGATTATYDSEVAASGSNTISLQVINSGSDTCQSERFLFRASKGAGLRSETWVLGGVDLMADPQELLPIEATFSPSTVGLAAGEYDLDLFVERAGAYFNLGTMTVTGTPNSIPTATAQSVSTPEDTQLTVTLTGSDADGDPLTFRIATTPGTGEAVLSGAQVEYTPSADFHGEDTFTFTAHDGAATSESAAVTIMVTPVNDAPVIANPGTQTARAGASFEVPIEASDVDGEDLTFAPVGFPSWLSLTDNGDNTATLAGTPFPSDVQQWTIEVQASDGALTGSIQFVIDVQPAVLFDCTTVTDVPVADCVALVALYQSTDGPNWSNTTNWFTPRVADWHGVQTADSRGVQYLDLGGNNLTGTIPPELGDMAVLKTLYLDGNALTGTLPAEMAALTSLRILHLEFNQFSGDFPEVLRSLPDIRAIWMHYNQLSGPLPNWLGSMPELLQLLLSGNDLTGPIPPQLALASKLTDLWLDGNPLGGSIPVELAQLASLRQLRLNRTELTGPIPSELGALSELRGLDLSSNALTGSIPSTLGDLSQLQLLYLRESGLSGPIPPELGQLHALVDIFLFGNQLSGPIPPQLGQLAQVRNFLLAQNQLTGPIPPSLGGLSSVTQLTLHDNQLSGPIPPELGDLTTLQHLFLTGNAGLSGAVPAELGNLTSLQQLALEDLGLSGPLPQELTNLTALVSLAIRGTEGLCAPNSEAFIQWLDALPQGLGNGPGYSFVSCPAVSTVSTTVAVGWNIIGSPFSETLAVSDLFPDAIAGTLFEFAGSYQTPSPESIVSGRGYWLRFSDGGSVSMEGTSANSVSLNMAEGWNMVSGPNCSVPLTAAVDGDAILLPGTFFGFDGSYQSAATFEPGEGYWLRALAAGVVTVTCTSSAKPGRDPLAGAARLQLKDGSGSVRELFLKAPLVGTEPGSYTPPPVAPGSRLKASFASGRYAEPASRGQVVLEGTATPLTLTTIEDAWIEIDGERRSVGAGMAVSLPTGTAEFVVGLSADEPISAGLTLDQNHPNPFDTNTQIRFSVPEQGSFRLEVFDVLGRRVAVPLDANLTAGWHQVDMDASALPVGVYVYRLVGGSGVVTRSMTIR
ncbi:MAG: cadherin-like domain-containing protein [Rhodothermales bacterium]|nr:cadherin-like domain-containing protein [Rhodothermales bacterium]